MTRLTKFAALAVTAFGMSACSQNDKAAGEKALGPGKVATVNGAPIAESVLRVYALASGRKSFDDLSAEDRGKLLDDLIGVEVLSQQAEKDGVAASRTVAAQIELQRLQLVARAMATSYLEKNPATDADLQKVYDENLPRLTQQQYKTRHILVETKAEAEQVITQLRAGKQFSDLAKERASGKTGPNGGDLPWFTAESMNTQIVTAVAGMKVGAFSQEPVQSEYGYHVLILDDSRKGEAPTMESLRKDLTTAVDRKRVDDYIKTLRMGAKVTLGP
ncbi:MAG: peptidyl-prolyl cis-trans isomerase [Gammaproteobacteria bacterium]